MRQLFVVRFLALSDPPQAGLIDPDQPAAVPAWAVFLRLAIPPPPIHLVPLPAAGAATGRRVGADPDFSTATRSRIGG